MNIVLLMNIVDIMIRFMINKMI